MECKFILLFFAFSFDLRTEVISLAILFPIKLPGASAFFLTTLFQVVFVGSITVFVGVSINFSPYLSPSFLANDKKPYPFTSKFWLC